MYAVTPVDAVIQPKICYLSGPTRPVFGDDDHEGDAASVVDFRLCRDLTRVCRLAC